MLSENLDNLNFSVDYFTHRKCTPTWSIIDAETNFVDITYVVKGTAEYNIEGIRHTVSAGKLLCIPKGNIRSAVSFAESPMECFCVNGQATALDGSPMTLELPLVSDVGHIEEVLELYNQLQNTWLMREGGYKARARGLFLIILQTFCKALQFGPMQDIYMDKRIQRVVNYIMNHYEEQMTVRTAAELVGLSVMYFGNLFKKETGMSFNRYLNTIRINRAEDLLSSCEYSVKEVALACGFSDMFYFSKTFKMFKGVSPSYVISPNRGRGTAAVSAEAAANAAEAEQDMS